MDEFLREINISVFHEWILMQQDDRYEIRDEGKVIVLENEAASAKTYFRPESIIELELTNRKNLKCEFYLHFRLQNLKHGTQLFKEMMQAFLNVSEDKNTRVLLSCTSGLTTNFFAQMLNEGARSTGLPLEFEACSYNLLADKGVEYDLIMLAPQIGWMEPRVQSIFNRTPVVTIPSKLFAAYDVMGTFAFVKEALEDQDDVPANIERQPLDMKVPVAYDGKVLVIACFTSAHHVHTDYRLYSREHILMNGERVKPDIRPSDLEDIIVMVMKDHPDLSVCSLAFAQGVEEALDVRRVMTGLSRKYNLHYVWNSVAGAAVTGIFAVQDTYDSLAFYTLPRGAQEGRIGSVVKGHLLTGKNSQAGRTGRLPLALSMSPDKLSRTFEGSLELVTKTLAALIAVNAPDMVAYENANVPDAQEVRQALLDYIPEDDLPVIVRIDTPKEYVLIGQNILAVKAVEEQRPDIARRH